MDTQHRLWTVGHSNLAWDDFVGMLQAAGIQALVDVRRFAGSRRNPQFGTEAMAEALPRAGIDYVPMPGLGGRRKPDPHSHNVAWRHPAFRAYADYMETADYQQARQRLAELASRERTAVMCAESCWWQCHRSLISDDFKADGWTVLHLQGGREKEHPYTGAARIVDGRLDYTIPEDGQAPLF